MANDEIPATERMTQSQNSLQASVDNVESQPVSVAWGRMYVKRVKNYIVDITEELFSVGRGNDSNIPLTNQMFTERELEKISRLHFKITRESCEFLKPVYIQDCSGNGTFVNGELIGKNRKRILQNDDVISLVNPNKKVFIFQDLGPNEAHGIPVDISSKYYIGYKLGAGSCGVVRLVYDRRSCVKYALKQVRKNVFTESASMKNLKYPVATINEVKIMKELHHPCVAKLHDIVDKPDFVYMVLEYMKGGDLLTRIVSKKRVSEQTSKLFFYQICSAVKYLHDKGITHRDLKPDNVLLQTNEEETLIKVSDFGLSKFFQNGSVMRTLCGTPSYVAPEVLETVERGTYTKKVDIWSLGVVLFTCLSGTLPFSDEYGSPASEQIKNGKFSFSHSCWRNISPFAKTLIMEMLTVDHNQRPEIDYILKHRWLCDTEMIRKCECLMSQLPSTTNESNYQEPQTKKRKLC